MSDWVTDGIASIRPYQPGTPIAEVVRRFGLDPARDVVKLASNENPLGPSPLAIDAARQALSGVHRYPDSAAADLSAAIARKFTTTTDAVVVGNGSNELLELIVRTFCTPQHHAVFGEPSFVVYPLACLAQGVPFTAVPLRDWKHDLPAMAAAVTERTRIVFVANPNNPTGTHVGEAELVGFLRDLPDGVIVVLDEAYAEYASAPDYRSGADLRALHPHLITLRTFSKIYGLAGFRVGYALMAESLAAYVHRVRAPFNVGSVAQAAALAALGDEPHLRRSREMNLAERGFLSQGLTGLGLTVVPSEANFVLVNIHRDAEPVYQALLRHGVIVRALGNLPQCLRISVGTRPENERCLSALATVLG